MPRKIIPDIVKRLKMTSVTPDITVYEGARIMAKANIAALIVTDAEGKLTGILTERDLAHDVIAAGLNSNNTLISEVMTTEPDTISPDDLAIDAFELMQTRGYRHLPVTEEGICVSIVSIRDLYMSVKETLEQEIKEAEAFAFPARYDT